MRQGTGITVAVLSILSGLTAIGGPARAASRPSRVTAPTSLTRLQQHAASFTDKGSLVAVAATSAHNGWAVGLAGRNTHPATLITHWNGKTWRRVASPTPGGSALLSGVAVTSARNAWAVGEADNTAGSTTLIEHWNGKVWKQVRSPSPGHAASLDDVVAVSAGDAWAVGATTSTSRKTLIEHWNGTVWKRVHSPGPSDSGLLGVTMMSAHNGWAVGSTFDVATNLSKSLIVHWNGKVWKRVRSPSPGGDAFLSGVTGTSAHDAWAVGCEASCGAAGFNVPLVERWNGRVWKRVATRLPDGIAYGVAATSGHNAWLVGTRYGSSGQSIAASGRTLVAHWNGKAWTKVRSVKPGVTSGLAGVTAGAHGTWAVGASGGSHQKALISRWQGGAWSVS